MLPALPSCKATGTNLLVLATPCPVPPSKGGPAQRRWPVQGEVPLHTPRSVSSVSGSHTLTPFSLCGSWAMVGEGVGRAVVGEGTGPWFGDAGVGLALTCHWIRTEEVVCGVAETDPGGSPGTEKQRTKQGRG